MTSITLPDLPLEVLQAICAQFCTHCTHKQVLNDAQNTNSTAQSTKTLVNLGRTCRALHQAVTPFVYHEFDDRAWTSHQVMTYLDTLHQHHDFAGSVQNLSIQTYDTYMENHDSFIKKVAKRHSLLLPSASSLHLGDRRLNGIFADLFLTLVPKVTKVDLAVCFGGEYGQFLPASKALPFVKQLRLIWNKQDSETLRITDFALLFAKMPNLETLEVNMCFSVPRGLPLGNITTLKLKDCVIKSRELRALVTGCNKLERFIFHASPNIGQYYTGIDTVVPKHIIQGLIPHKAILRHLEIKWPWLPFLYDENKELIRSLKEFEALETLYLDVDCLCFDTIENGDDFEQSYHTMPNSLIINLLPPSIRTVALDGERLSLYEPILALARRAKKGSFPQFKEFKVTGYKESFSPFHFGNVRKAMETSGISFEASPRSIFS
ncbi:hypothetical protein FSARC_12556 [Fusarium sarcochroum]|uniref:F-box domain-containing protein n=1 Tax=Fusarium sarcochroum TaxID=1208366 RepID=A0A8H4T7P3_9HYPO|nr:hypothetical protein FSARC_12556 [Fusarium sarcochroum]